MRSLPRLLARFLAALLLATTAAAKEPAPGEGYVLLQYNFNVAPGGGMGMGWPNITVATDPIPGKWFSSRERTFGPVLWRDNGVIYAAKLPPGTYHLSALATKDFRTDFKHGATGKFTVETGRLTYLGWLMELSSDRKVLLAHQGSATDAEEARALAARFEWLPSFADQPVLGWIDGSYDDALMKELHRFIRLNASSVQSILDMGAEGLLFGTRNGLIRGVTPGRPTRHLDTGSRFSISGLVRLPDERLLACDDDFRCYASADLGLTWKQEATLPLKGNLQALKAAPDGSLVAMLRVGKPAAFGFNDVIQVYHGRLGAPDWKMVLEAPPVSDVEAALYLQGNRAFVTVHADDLPAIDLATDTVTNLPLPGYVLNFSQSPDGRFFADIQTRGSNPVNGQYHSQDARHWSLLKAPEPIDLLCFRDESLGFAAAFHTKRGAVYFTTADGGASWTESAADQPTGILACSSTGAIYAKGRNGFMFTSTDAGKTWARTDARQ